MINSQLEQQPDATLFFKKCRVLKKQILFPEAIEQLDEALKLDSLNAGYLAERADLSESLGNYDSALNSYNKAISVQPDDLLIKYNMGQTLIRINDYKSAVKTFEDIYAIDSTNVMYNKYYALAMYKAGFNKKATELYEKYILQNPNDLTAYLNLAHAYGEIKKGYDCIQNTGQSKETVPE